MHIETYPPGQIPDEIAEAGRTYILKRFMDEWRIDRDKEITKASIINRTNLVAFNNSSIVGWLSVNADGELVNGCAGPNGQAGAVFLKLIKQAISQESPNQYYAYTPIDYLSSAYICISAGLRLSKDRQGQVLRKVYKNRIVTLAKLVLETPEPPFGPSNAERRERREELHQLIDSLIGEGLFNRALTQSKRLFARLRRASPLAQLMTRTPSTALALAASFIYYLIIVHFLGGGLPKYYEFLSNQKPAVDAGELSKYLEISTNGLRDSHELIKDNASNVIEFIEEYPEREGARPEQVGSILVEDQKRKELVIAEQETETEEDAKDAEVILLLGRLKASFIYMAWILEQFEEDVRFNRLDAAKKAVNRYEILILYLSSSGKNDFENRLKKIPQVATVPFHKAILNRLLFSSVEKCHAKTKPQGGEGLRPEKEDNDMRNLLAERLGAICSGIIEDIRSQDQNKIVSTFYDL